MTHYAPDEYFHNNKNDALFTDSRPINKRPIYNYVDTDDAKRVAEDSFENNEYNITSTSGDYDISGVEWCVSVSSATTTFADKRSFNQNYVHDYMEDYGHIVDTGIMTNDGNDTGREIEDGDGDYWNENGTASNEYECAYSDYRYAPVSGSASVPTKILPSVPMMNSSCSTLPRQDFISETGDDSACGVRNVHDAEDLIATATGKCIAGTSNYDILGQISRPYTSMLPLDYNEYSEFGCNADNMSTYSDTPPMSNAQHKLQQQRKISLMMAMTTASVIASGETRVPVSTQQQQNSKLTQKCSNYSITPTPAFTNANATAIASDRWFKSELTPTTILSDTTTKPLTSTTTRKLPNFLSSQTQYKSPLLSTTVVPAIESITTSTLPQSFNRIDNESTLQHKPIHPFEKASRSKQLPKLPIQKVKNNFNCNSNLNVSLSSTSSTSSNLGAHSNRPALVEPVSLPTVFSPDNIATVDCSSNLIASSSIKTFRDDANNLCQVEQKKSSIVNSDVNIDNKLSDFTHVSLHDRSPIGIQPESTISMQSTVISPNYGSSKLDVTQDFSLKSTHTFRDLSLDTNINATNIITNTTNTTNNDIESSSFSISDYLKPLIFQIQIQY
ncbi:uncharacterized protein LOC108607325 [Drosophila busckii]|uniref:uncharacterized protein LOC108607325 n=1 Tax=Drosophila busckii TaxID=30019 RepID=UPI00083F4FF4|nr:uncharacterized protein LOC108607325 [Drosophila busckii]